MTNRASRQVRVVLMGVGNVGRRFLELLVCKKGTLRERLGLELIVVGVADSSGVAICPTGLDPQQIVKLKGEGKGASACTPWARPGVSSLEMARTVEADLLLEASPVNLKDGQPGLGYIETALSRGMHVVTANKGPLALAFSRLVDLARERGVQLRYDATVAGGLPAVNLGRRDLAAADILRLEGILNLTTNYVLTRMAQDGLSYEQALAEARTAGNAEADPSLDVEGWDAANKLIILAHSVLRYPAMLDEVDVQGITHIDCAVLEQAAAQGKRIKPLAIAERKGDGYRLSVGPVGLDAGHPLAQLGCSQMGVVYHTDINGVISAAIVEETPLPSASAMLSDVVQIYSDRAW
jgi:homoserine dehydrogenase